MKVHTTKFYTITILSLLAFVMASSVCSAQVWSRAGKTEIYGTFQTMSSATATSGANIIALDSSTVYGLGFGYNVDNHFNLNTDILFGSTDFAAVVPPALVAGDMNLFLWNVNLDYNFLEDRFTPLVTGGIGFMSLETAISDDINFSYNLGAGARYDITDNFFIKAMYRMTWTKMEGFGDLDFDGIMLSIGYMF